MAEPGDTAFADTQAPRRDQVHAETVPLRRDRADDELEELRVDRGPGDVLADRYRLVEMLGAGGMGEVWRAVQVDLGQEVAIKLLKEASLDATERTEMRARFQMEARILSHLDDPRVVQVLDHGETEDGTLFIVMELLEGQTLEAKLKAEGRFAADNVLQLVMDVADGVGSAHARGLVHRDLKPGNIFLQAQTDGPPLVRILDFGIAKSLTPGSFEGAPKTRTGCFIGSPHYMAPEQFEGKPCAATDIYALGVIAWECLAGRRPFEGTTASVVGKHLMQEPPELPFELDVPEEVGRLVLEMLEKKPDHRPRSLKELWKRAKTIRESLEPPPRRSRARFVLWSLFVLALGLGAAEAVQYEAEIVAAVQVLLTPPSTVPEGMVRVDGGPFFMGCSPASDPGCETKESVGRTVEVESFAIDKVEVSVFAYGLCVASGSCSATGLNRPEVGGKPIEEQAEHCNWGKPGREQHPINCVSWYDAAAYCAFRGARLPTEVEWEKAARGVDARRFPWGNAPFDYREANVADRTARRKYGWRFASKQYNDLRAGTGAVGELPDGASPYGALDMLGNVWEWTAGEGRGRPVFRGASFLEAPEDARLTRREIADASTRGVNVGFRCASSL